MIDTEKYEGHTPAEEWGGKDKIIFADGYRAIFLDDDVYATQLDTQLMTDAPLLLAEIRRQQKTYVNLLRNYTALQDYAHELEVKSQESHDAIDNIAHIIHYQEHLKEQDKWLARMIEEGLVTIEGDEEE
tara:strand:- start:67 stop:456 length:390 start_codon:yes stop_codon:yes gene_type:complete